MVKNDGVDDDDDLVGLANYEVTYSDHHNLITAERAAKLELLMHVLAHLDTPILVCAPKSVGKTTFLKALKESLTPSPHYFELTVSTDFDFADWQQAINQNLGKKQPKSMIVVIDNAGLLPPGTINAIFEYVSNSPRLKLIIALTPDELYLKNSSDNLVTECSVIEIPLLNEKQCRDFLQYLAARPDTLISLTDVNEETVAQLYRKTHGVPGYIIDNLPLYNRQPKSDRTLIILITMVIFLVAITLSLQWLKPNLSSFSSLFRQAQPTNFEPQP